MSLVRGAFIKSRLCLLYKTKNFPCCIGKRWKLAGCVGTLCSTVEFGQCSSVEGVWDMTAGGQVKPRNMCLVLGAGVGSGADSFFRWPCQTTTLMLAAGVHPCGRGLDPHRSLPGSSFLTDNVAHLESTEAQLSTVLAQRCTFERSSCVLVLEHVLRH